MKKYLAAAEGVARTPVTERDPMLLNVEYLRDPADLSSQCWALLPLALDLEAATSIARAMSEGFGARLDALSLGGS